ncbi:MAG: LacI family transcriptional regulator [Firmicutes bacterium HGW-Firmicutes-7]|nr:MAG: LacI family transcriptional regulator [Firmicutes bacterium HGW-Firmicutes-7]
MTIKDVAKVAGVSIATVSRVINKDTSVSPVTTKKVKKAIKEINYIPNTVGRNLRKSKSEMILVMLPTLSNPFYSKILKGIEERATEQGYGVLISVTHHDVKVERKYLKMLTTKQVDGAISLFSKLSLQEINDLASNYPFVQCCEYTEDAKLSYVMIDNQNAAYEATQYFIKKGHQCIGMISGSFYASSEKLREQGYKNALIEAGIDYDPTYIMKSNYKPESAMEICQTLLQLDPAPTALIAVSDTLAIGAIKYLKSIGMEAGVDIEIIGFDNASIASLYEPSISTVAQPRYDLGTTSVELVIEKINNLHSVNKKIILPHEILFRESTTSKK